MLSIDDRDRRNQPIAALRDGLDRVGLLRIVHEQPAQFRDRARKDIVRHGGIRPRRVEQLVFRHHLPGALGQTDEHQHHLGFEACDAAWAGHPVERRLDDVALADPERLLHGFAQ